MDIVATAFWFVIIFVVLIGIALFVQSIRIGNRGNKSITKWLKSKP